MAHCDYWWVAGRVEWCDLLGGNCRCGGWEESCTLKKRRRKSDRHAQVQMMLDDEDIRRYSRHGHYHR
ncbi:MAG: hypothetical protein HYX78_08365 [Armatimonadetes bacterium]|nr:hypothetical protein [Armatimonadota bacterium]